MVLLMLIHTSTLFAGKRRRMPLFAEFAASAPVPNQSRSATLAAPSTTRQAAQRRLAMDGAAVLERLTGGGHYVCD